MPMGGADSDVGRYLRVVATYTDGGPTSGDKTATAVSEYRTIGRIFTNTVPEFPATSAARAVLEESRKGTAIGIPITATDADSGEKLTYWLTNDTDENFEIDPRTGQLRVNNVLNYDAVEGVVTTRTYSITVNVADSSGTTSSDNDPKGTDTVMVIITVTNVDEKPEFSETGESTIEVMENETVLGADAVDNYMATDPEGAVVTFTLSGDDGDKFELGDVDTAASNCARLRGRAGLREPRRHE